MPSRILAADPEAEARSSSHLFAQVYITSDHHQVEQCTTTCSSTAIPPFSLLGDDDHYDNLDELRSHLPHDTSIQDAYPCKYHVLPINVPSLPGFYFGITSINLNIPLSFLICLTLVTTICKDADIKLARSGTPLQEGLFALSLRQQGLFMLQAVYRLPQNVDILRFKAAWQACHAANSTMRTRFIHTKSWGTIQAVLDNTPIEWLEDSDLEEYLNRDHHKSPEFGSNLLRFAIITEADTEQKTFVWTLHHALIDGFSWRLLLDQVDQIYLNGTSEPLVQFNIFIAHLGRLIKSENHSQFWSQYLDSSLAHVFPTLPSETYLPCANSSEELHIRLPGSLKSIAIASTIIQAAYAVLVAGRTTAEEATFGQVLAGRNLDIPGYVNYSPVLSQSGILSSS